MTQNLLFSQVFDGRGNGGGDVVPTVTGDHNAHISDYTALCVDNEQKDQQAVLYARQRSDEFHESEVCSCESARQHKDATDVITDDVVRRLTPMECERLQGYPDHWTDLGDWVDSKGKTHKDADTPRYKALGNSIALPFWQWMAERMVKHIDHKPTMASLFDGIGGFPLVFSRVGCEPIWASEIEEFPIAVTKKHFQEMEGEP